MKNNILDFFDQTVKNYPERIIAGDIHKQISFSAFHRMAERSGSGLGSKGYTACPVAILMERTVNLPVAMTAVLYSGSFYTVLDPDSPEERLNRIINTLEPSVLIYESSTALLAEKLNTRAEKISFETLKNCPADSFLLGEIRKNLTSETPAYTLFTSGSTGDPKGALLTHGNVISYISWFTECFDITEDTVFGSQTPLYFSMSVSDFYSCIFKGSSYEIIPKEYFAFPAKLISHMNERKINTIYWVPSALGMIVKFNLLQYACPEYLKKVLFAGETMPVRYLNYFRKYLPDILYANLFGPTETTDICAYYIVDREFSENENLPIGIPCNNCELFTVDKELYVKGPFVAKGYYNNPFNTGFAFVQNPCHNHYPDIVYKTGDLVEKDQHGLYRYIGRKDFQIKHMGHRIEPGEIETILNGACEEVMTMCIHEPVDDILILVYESTKDMSEELDRYAAAELPAYMHPGMYKRIDQFPLNSNGKTDRKAVTKKILNELTGGK